MKNIAIAYEYNGDFELALYLYKHAFNKMRGINKIELLFDSKGPLTDLPYDADWNFIEKDKLFDLIKTLFDVKNKVIINGYPGVGKTTQAVHYALTKFKYGTTRLINAETPSQIEGSYREMGQILAIEDSQTKDIDILVQEIDTKLKRDCKSVLLIFDNVKDVKDIEKYTKIGRSRVFYIITTRNSNISIEGGIAITLDPLNREEAQKVY